MSNLSSSLALIANIKKKCVPMFFDKNPIGWFFLWHRKRICWHNIVCPLLFSTPIRRECTLHLSIGHRTVVWRIKGHKDLFSYWGISGLRMCIQSKDNKERRYYKLLRDIQIIFLYRYKVLQRAKLGLYRRLHGKVKRDCRDRLSSINKGTPIVFLKFDGLPDWNSCIIVILYSTVCN